MPNPKLFIILNALSFQLVWWAGVLAGNQLVLLSILLILGHFLLSQSPRQDLQLMFLCAVVGMSVDTVLTWVGVFVFAETPYWLALLWLAFALTLRYSLVFFQKIHMFWQALFGGVFGTLSYIAGAEFGAVMLPYGLWVSGIVLVVIWSGLFPVLLLISRGEHAASLTQESQQ
ncbi:DUF2878 domain-containing protein [Shewanella ulleungensis]|uniref:DUF2878 domain-containing protein n=1 Tax=Shewanella ulleungensis TaxID=2282699 RepID=A0ABQ2QGN9_9GAMM|nr:DUF2878 domain-containing protein [Shewanella ulleungensis]MCL1149552.1 DUF2878 domain-containing protein [Shewanella ulleungensis]GGP79864.1 hypothetical protein GCM10009410_10540 [Shewanella ulleungensis]